MSKINDTMFCISMERDVHLFYLITNPEEKAKMKVKKVFGMVPFTLTTVNEKIEVVTGNNSNLIFIGTRNHLLVLEIMDSKGNGTKDSLQLRFTKPIPELLTILTLQKRLVALSATHLHECTPPHTQSKSEQPHSQKWQHSASSSPTQRKRLSTAPSNPSA